MPHASGAGKNGKLRAHLLDAESGEFMSARVAWCVKESFAIWLCLFGVAESRLRAGAVDAIAAVAQSKPVHVSEVPFEHKVLLVCFLLHYANRAFVFALRLRPRAPRDYPVETFFFGLAFNALNGYQQGRALGKSQPPPSLLGLPDVWVFWTGVALFAAGLTINVHSDGVLRQLRRDRGGDAGGDAKSSGADYAIPRGGLFEYVSVANYFGEVLEFAGFALAARSLQAVSFAVLTLCYLVPRAYLQHKWYLDKFRDEYPRNRRAVIPFLL